MDIPIGWQSLKLKKSSGHLLGTNWWKILLPDANFLGWCLFCGVLIDVSTDISVDCRSTYRSLCRSRVDQVSAEYWLSVCRESVNLSAKWCCPVDLVSVDRSTTVGWDSVGGVLAMYWWIVIRVSVRYQWCIGQQSELPRVGQYIGRVMFYCRSSIAQQIIHQWSFGDPSAKRWPTIDR